MVSMSVRRRSGYWRRRRREGVWLCIDFFHAEMIHHFDFHGGRIIVEIAIIFILFVVTFTTESFVEIFRLEVIEPEFYFAPTCLMSGYLLQYFHRVKTIDPALYRDGTR